MNTYLGNLKNRTQPKKSQNQQVFFTNQVSALIRPPYNVLSIIVQFILIHITVRVFDWGSTYQSNLKRLITLEKRVIRIISKSPFNEHDNPIFVSLRIRKFEDLIK